MWRQKLKIKMFVLRFSFTFFFKFCKVCWYGFFKVTRVQYYKTFCSKILLFGLVWFLFDLGKHFWSNDLEPKRSFCGVHLLLAFYHSWSVTMALVEVRLKPLTLESCGDCSTTVLPLANFLAKFRLGQKLLKHSSLLHQV